MSEVIKTYHYTGELKSEVYYVNGKKNGEYKKYYENGQLWEICSYTNDKKNEKYKMYDNNGELIMEN